MTSDAVAVFDVVEELSLEFAGNGFAVDSGSEIRPLQSGRERAR
jgi:hypothetical protein